LDVPYITHIYKDSGRNKLEDRAKKAIFIGYLQNGEGYLWMDMDTLTIESDMSAEFNENDFPAHEMDWSEWEPESPEDSYQPNDENEENIDQEYDSDSENETASSGQSDTADPIDGDNESDVSQDAEAPVNAEQEVTDQEDSAHENENEMNEGDEYPGADNAELNDEQPQEVVLHQQLPRGSGRIRRAPESYGSYGAKTKMTVASDKKNFKQAMAINKKETYKNAIVEYLKDLLDSGAIKVVERPNRKFNLIRSRWVVQNRSRWKIYRSKDEMDTSRVHAKTGYRLFGNIFSCCDECNKQNCIRLRDSMEP
jgi:hypothetical protein